MSDPQDPAEAARLRRQRMLRRAVENMGVLPNPRATEGAVAVSPAPPGVSVAPSGPLTPEEKAFAQVLDKRLAELAGKDHFSVLGVPQTGNKDQVKVAFLQLAKTFHPDRLPEALKPSHGPVINTVFDAIRAAYDGLYEDAARAEYLERLKAGPQKPGVRPGSPGEPVPVAQQVRELLREGDLHLKKREFSRAENAFGRAHALDGQGETLAAQAWAVFLDPARKAELAAVERMLSVALKLDPRCARAHYQVGLMAKAQGNEAAAERSFRAAVAANPRHAEASAEVRLIEIRKKSAAAGPAKRGLFGL